MQWTTGDRGQDGPTIVENPKALTIAGAPSPAPLEDSRAMKSEGNRKERRERIGQGP